MFCISNSSNFTKKNTLQGKIITSKTLALPKINQPTLVEAIRTVIIEQLNKMHKEFINCVFILLSLLFPHRCGRTRVLISACETGEADFTDLLFLLPSNLMRKSTLMQKPSAQIPKVFHQHEKVDQKKI